MTYRTETEVVEPVAPAAVVRTHTTDVRYRSNPMASVERAIVFLFGLVQLLIVLRILLLLVAARQGNDIVQFVYGTSELFVAPFRGILRIDEVQAGATALDVGAIVALIGWFVIELVVIGLVRLFRPAATA